MCTALNNLVPLTRVTDEQELLELERKYCSWGDTVHYLDPPKFFDRAEGNYLYDREGTPYLDLQMWYSAASFGYGNERLNNALKDQIDKLPQLACQYLHPEKVELAAAIARLNESKFGLEGRVHFNVGGAQAIEDSLKIVRNATGKNLVFAFMGGYHGRTLGASAITSSYRYRRRFGHFSDRAHFVPFPYCFRCPYGKKREDCGLYCVEQFEKNFETEYNSFWDAKAGESEFSAFYVEPIQGTGGYVIPPPEYFPALKRVLDERNILLVDDEIQMGFYRRKILGHRKLQRRAGHHRLRQSSDERFESSERSVGARGVDLAGQVSARLDAFDLLIESARHGCRPGSRPHDGRERLRSDHSAQRCILSRADSRFAATLSESHRRHGRDGHGLAHRDLS